MSSAAALHMAAHSRSSWIHRAIIFTLSSCKQEAAQWLQATAQA
ncbi:MULTISPECIES: hypothetical protein [Sphingobacterium]|nr:MULTISPECIES: hypothetical protein [Sphingobacterium]